MGKIEKWTKMQEFTRDQIAEIEAGLKAGLDVSVYAKKEFLSIQMRQIRLGMQQGLAIEKYATPEYDWFQMEEIRNGLAEGINVEAYAYPELSYDKMHQIRLGLKEGMDLTPFCKLGSGILRELRLSLLAKVNIIPYIKAGYGTEQLAAIRGALEKGLDIDPYLQKELRGISIQEICTGLEEGLDVSIYAKTEYYWQQMREIRLGLENMADVEQYRNPFYSWQQMQEIRLGLEEGLDVSYYKSLMYTPREMQKRRLYLKEHPISVHEKKTEYQETDSPDNFVISMSMDEMEAYLELKGNSSGIERMEIMKALHRQGICYGIDYEVIEEVVRGNCFRKPMLIASGMPPEDGKDGWYEFFFRTQVARTPKELEDGNVDYRNIEWFETVEAGQKLAYYHSATQGKKGTTVTGRQIPARKGREQSILTGIGFRRLEDRRTYIASKKGIVTIQNLRLEVSDLLVVNDVNLATGNIEFDGSVCVKGNVSSGTRIKATRDIAIEGYVEAAEIISGGNVAFQQEMNAAGAGSVHAAGNVIGCFFEATDIYAAGNIQGDYFLNCKLYAERKVIIIGKKGMLAGGTVHAEAGLRAFNLGNNAGLATFIKLGMGERIVQKENELDNAIRNVNHDLFIFQNAHQDLQRKYPPEIRNSMEIYLKIESAVYTKEKEMEKLLQEKNKLKDDIKQAEFVNAVIENKLYEGVTFEIDGIRWASKRVQGVTIRKIENRIAVFANSTRR